MKLFNRKKTIVNDPSIPPEVQAYSQAEHRERMGVAWLVGVVSLVLFTFILAGLFFGGRWMYQTIAGTNNSDTQSQPSNEGDQPTKEKEQPKEENNPAATPEGDQPSTPTPSTTPPPQTAPTTTPTTGPTIPRTGPDSDE